MMDVDALVFDLDGTLANTMPAHFLAWTRTLQTLGLEHLFPEDRFYRMGGIPAVRILETLSQEAGVTLDIERISHEKEALFVSLLDEVEPIVPVVEIARSARGKLPMAVATGSMRMPAQTILRQLGLSDWFEVLVAAEDVERHKPDPDVFLEAARRLGVAPQRCRAFEDTDVGMLAARQAGMEVVDVRPLYMANVR